MRCSTQGSTGAMPAPEATTTMRSHMRVVYMKPVRSGIQGDRGMAAVGWQSAAHAPEQAHWRAWHAWLAAGRECKGSAVLGPQ